MVRTSILAVLAMSIFWSATYLSAEPLLACVLSGIITINRKYDAFMTLSHWSMLDVDAGANLYCVPACTPGSAASQMLLCTLFCIVSSSFQSMLEECIL